MLKSFISYYAPYKNCFYGYVGGVYGGYNRSCLSNDNTQYNK